ncbi:MAG: hypothetical protein QOK44_4311 [Betaproteobacteria bacterium]|jgi:hypothetical protein|nr:hypothetical protein [Betaproteobacteria bacterium]
MKAVIFSMPLATASKLGWRWRAEDHSVQSGRAFWYYADCVADAKRAGLSVIIGRALTKTALRPRRAGLDNLSRSARS